MKGGWTAVAVHPPFCVPRLLCRLGIFVLFVDRA